MLDKYRVQSKKLYSPDGSRRSTVNSGQLWFLQHEAAPQWMDGYARHHRIRDYEYYNSRPVGALLLPLRWDASHHRIPTKRSITTPASMGCQSPQDTQQEEYYYSRLDGMLVTTGYPAQAVLLLSPGGNASRVPPPKGGSIFLSFSIVRRYPFPNLGRARQYGVNFLV